MVTAGSRPPLPLTGERTVPGVGRENYWFRRHEVVYRWLVDFLDGRLPQAVVVDAGCGEGYGAEMLSRAGAQCLAVDLDFPTVNHVQGAHATREQTDDTGRVGRLRPLVANLDALPLRDASVDVIVTFQVIEHLWDVPRFLNECFRVLRPQGSLAMSTPNRITFSPGLGRGDEPVNPFHREEFDADQLTDLSTGAGFSDAHTIGLHHGQRILHWEKTHGSLVAAQIEAINSRHWTSDLADFVSSVTAADFVVDSDTRQSLDLISTATRPVSSESVSVS